MEVRERERREIVRNTQSDGEEQEKRREKIDRGEVEDR